MIDYQLNLRLLLLDELGGHRSEAARSGSVTTIAIADQYSCAPACTRCGRGPPGVRSRGGFVNVDVSRKTGTSATPSYLGISVFLGLPDGKPPISDQGSGASDLVHRHLRSISDCQGAYTARFEFMYIVSSERPPLFSSPSTTSGHIPSGRSSAGVRRQRRDRLSRVLKKLPRRSRCADHCPISRQRPDRCAREGYLLPCKITTSVYGFRARVKQPNNHRHFLGSMVTSQGQSRDERTLRDLARQDLAHDLAARSRQAAVISMSHPCSPRKDSGPTVTIFEKHSVFIRRCMTVRVRMSGST